MISPPDKPANIKIPNRQKAEFLMRLVSEYTKRITDALELYVPLPAVEAFHRCTVRKRLARGSNRAGKTLLAGSEIARIVRGRDPYAEAKGLPNNDGRVLCVGADATHLAQTMWKKISWPGAFWTIPDEHTGILRSVRPNPNDPTRLDDYDESQRPKWLGGDCRASKWKPSGPFLPPNEIKDIAYEKRNLDQVKRVVTKNGWEMLWHTSEGNLRKGIDINLAWFDEDIKSPRWFAETFARLVDRDGSWIWSFTPEESTTEALQYHNIAETDPEVIAEFELQIDDNPYLTSKAKREFYNALSEDERTVKYYGGYAANARKVYGTFDPDGVHRVKPFEIPANWMRVAAHDPGTQRLGTLLCAVNPAATELHVYDEVFLRKADAVELAKRLKEKVTPYRWQSHIVDSRAGRITPFGLSKRVKEHYEDEFAKEWGVPVSLSWGSDDVPAREEAVRSLLRIDGQGHTKLKVHTENVPNFCKQMKAQFYKLEDPNKPSKTEKRDKAVDELSDCMEYIAAFFSHGLFYEPPTFVEELDPEQVCYRLFQAKLKKNRLQAKRDRALGVWEHLEVVR